MKSNSTNVNRLESAISKKRLILFLALVAILLYSNTINHSYVYDDFSIFKGNSVVTKGISAIPEILMSPYRFGFYEETNAMYRPLSKVMFAIEYQLFNDNPSKSHLINILIFAGCVVILFLFFVELLGEEAIIMSFLASLLFALHPIHTEVVANIKSRDELLCFLLAFSGTYTYMLYARLGKMKYFIIGSILFFASLLSKETSITFIAIIPLIFFVYKNENIKRSVLITAGSVIAAAFFLLIRYHVLESYNSYSSSHIPFIDNFLTQAPSFPTKIATEILILGKYIQLLFIPYPLICDYSFNSLPFVDFSNFQVLVSLVIYIGLIAVALFRLIKYKHDTIAFGISFYLITISLFSNILFLIGAPMAERFLFFSSVGFCLVVALFVDRYVINSKGSLNLNLLFSKTVLWIILPIVIVYAILTFNRNADWSDNKTLFETDMQKSPQNARLKYFFANELLKQSQSTQTDIYTRTNSRKSAIDILGKSLEIYPDYNDANRMMGNGYFLITDYDSAERYLKRALEIKPDDFDALSNLDIVYFNAKKYPQSIDICKKILEDYPTTIIKYNNIATCFIKLSQYDSAVFYLKKGISIDAGYTPLYKTLSLIYELNNETDSANKYKNVEQ